MRQPVLMILLGLLTVAFSCGACDNDGPEDPTRDDANAGDGIDDASEISDTEDADTGGDGDTTPPDVNDAADGGPSDGSPGDGNDDPLGCRSIINRGEYCVAGDCQRLGFVPLFEEQLSGEVGEQIVEAVYTPAGGGYWFVVAQKSGTVTAVHEETGVTHAAVSIPEKLASNHGEAGLLGLAFPPDFPARAEVYLSYTARGSSGMASVVTRMPVNTTDWTFNKGAEEEIIRYPQPAGNHNGGKIVFGPDGYLYISWGDGGGANNQYDNGQNKNTLLGTILRLDVTSSENAEGKAYAIPADNPFVGTDGADEIYAWGLRNTWKFSFDAANGRLFGADVGQGRIEEVNIIEAGGNYGWSLKEGRRCFDAPEPCDAESLGVIDPIWQYSHAEGRSITGGYVYRGAQIPALVGTYLVADYTNGKLWSVRENGDGSWVESLIRDTAFLISGFAETGDRELVLFNYRVSDGPTLLQLVPIPDECHYE